MGTYQDKLREIIEMIDSNDTDWKAVAVELGSLLMVILRNNVSSSGGSGAIPKALDPGAEAD